MTEGRYNGEQNQPLRTHGLIRRFLGKNWFKKPNYLSKKVPRGAVGHMGSHPNAGKGEW